MKNSCNAPIMSKSFRMAKRKARKVLDKETIDHFLLEIDNSQSLKNYQLVDVTLTADPPL